jgi:hypothetical protein
MKAIKSTSVSDDEVRVLLVLQVPQSFGRGSSKISLPH